MYVHHYQRLCNYEISHFDLQAEALNSKREFFKEVLNVKRNLLTFEIVEMIEYAMIANWFSGLVL